MPKTWTIIIKFNNGHHIEQARITLGPIELENNQKIRDVIDKDMLAKLAELKWQGFGLWAYHVAITKDTQFEAVEHQLTEDGVVQFDCEDHVCHYRQIHPNAPFLKKFKKPEDNKIQVSI